MQVRLATPADKQLVLRLFDEFSILFHAKDVLYGSGETWHYKIVWVGSELENSPCWREGGYPIWGQFEVIMSHGTYDGMHEWDAHALPSGYGGF